MECHDHILIGWGHMVVDLGRRQLDYVVAIMRSWLYWVVVVWLCVVSLPLCYAQDIGCPELELRIVGDRDIVEICINNEWIGVTSDNWSFDEVYVACRQLGFELGGTQSTYLTLPVPEQQNSTIVAFRVEDCNGNELRLFDCTHTIQISLGTEAQVSVGATCIECLDREVRVGGGGVNSASGVVEVCLSDEWRSVTSQSWGDEEATVVCRQLRYDGGTGAVVPQAFLGSGLLPFEDVSIVTVLNVTECRGSELVLFECDVTIVIDVISEPVAVEAMCTVCNHSEARLVDGPSPSEGLLEVCRDGRWGTVCDDLWGIRETLVACRQLGYTSGEFTMVPGGVVEFSTQEIFLDDVFCSGSESFLFECRFQSSSDCGHSEDVHLRCFTPSVSECTEGGTRLAGGSLEEDGYLELCLAGQWYPVDVCPNEWDARDSRVVCRQFGYPTGDPNYVFEVSLGSHDGSNAVILNDVHCNGSEPDLFSCEREVGADQYCSRIRAGVTCVQGCADNHVQIVGSSSREGRVQYCYQGEWGSISACNSTWSDTNAEVVCRNLTLGTGFALNTFAGRSAPVVLSGVVCSGSESNLAECSRASIGPLEGEDCQDLDVGVICQVPRCEADTVSQQDGAISLCNSAFIKSSVCANLWDARDARIACMDLGHFEESEAIAVYVSNPSGLQGRASVDCQQIDFLNTLFGCSINETFVSCTEGLAGVICDLSGYDMCSDTEVRLIPTEDSIREPPLAGRVEFCYRGLWGTVCSDGFGDVDAGVVCRQLGFATGFLMIDTSLSATLARPPQTHGAILLSGLECDGSEQSLANCNHSGINIHTCRDHSQDVHVFCIECIESEVRLVDPESGSALPAGATTGQVQVCVAESWASVGGSSWETEDAQVVCRQLGFNDAVSGVNSIRYPDGIFSQRVLAEFNCTGDEAGILQCGYMFAMATLTYGGVRCEGLNDSSSTTASPGPSFPPPGSSAVAIGVGVGVAGVFLLLVIIGSILVVVVICRRSRKEDNIGNLYLRDSNIYLESQPYSQDALSRRYTNITKNFPEDMFISADTIRLLDSIGQGEFGIVYKAHLVRPQHSLEEKLSRVRAGSMPSKVVAVKTLHGHFNEGDISETLRESAKMKDFDHPHVLSMLGVCIDAGPAPYIVMPFMSNGSLQSYLRKERANLVLPADTDPDTVGEVQKKLADMCMQIAKGMEYLASKSFIHRDLATRNCMIDNAGIIKVADFGLSENTYSKTYFRQGKDSSIKLPIKWMAPESINDGVFSEKSDVWSFGVTCWEVFTGAKTPYPGQHPQAVITLLDNGERMAKPANAACSDQIYSIMLNCWEADPNHRPAFTQLGQSISGVLEGLADYFDLNAVAVMESSDADKQKSKMMPAKNAVVDDTASSSEHDQFLSGDPVVDSTTAQSLDVAEDQF